MMEIDVPMHGIWSVQNSPANKVPSHGTYLFGTAYAIDLVMLDTKRKFYKGAFVSYLLSGVLKEDCYGYGQEVLSASDGEVVEAYDGIKEREKVNIRSDLRYARQVNKKILQKTENKTDIVGNYVVIKHNDCFILYAHLRLGSVSVKAEDKVKCGQPIGQVGHSGNSLAPHLHLQIIDNLDYRKANAVPFVFKELDVKNNGSWERKYGYLPRNNEFIRKCT
jgi:hypothetical protein